MGRWDLSVGQRLALGFGAVVALVICLTGASVQEFSYLDALQYQMKVLDERVGVAAQLETANLATAAAAHSYAFTGEDADLQAYLKASANSQSALTAFEAVPVEDPDNSTATTEIATLATEYRAATDRFVTLTQQRADAQSIHVAETTMTNTRTRFVAQADAYLALQRQKQQAASATTEQAQADTLRVLLFLGGLIAAVSVATAVAAARSVQGPVRRLAKVASALIAGDYATAVALRPAAPPPGSAPVERPRDELRLLSEALGHAGAALDARERRLEARNRVSEALAANLEVGRVATAALAEIIAYARCEFGAIYTLSDDAHTLHRVAAYALDATETISADEGIPSAALASLRLVVVRDLPGDAPWRARFGFADLPPRVVVALPLVVDERAVGLLLVGSVRDLGEDELGFIEHSAPPLGLSLQNALAHREIDRLATALQAQNKELQAQNEEIQAQSEEIQAQNEEIQAQNEEMQGQNEALVEADRLKDEFLALASHELKSPITSIKGYSQLLLRRMQQHAELAPYGEILHTIDRSSNTLLQRINRLLDASRARMGRLELHSERLDLVAFVRQQADLAQMRSDRHRIVVDVDADRLVGIWDHAYLEQALANLLDNAIRYSPQGGEVRLTLRQSGSEAVVAVADQGIGMPPDALARVFQSYYRHDSAKQVTGDGLGIGLFLTHAIVVAHGGRIWAESEPGAGSTFYVALPLAEPAPVEAAALAGPTTTP